MPLLFLPTPNPYRPHLPTWRQPLHLHLAPVWLKLEATLKTCRGRVLDVGCGLQPYRAFLDVAQTEYIGLDREGPLSRPTLVGNAEAIPLPDSSVDVVLSTQVLEHLPEPALALKEALRVLRPGGRLILSVPGVWPAHETPHDYWRFTRDGVVHLMRSHGVDFDEVVGLGKFWATLGQMANLALYRSVLLREFVPLVNLVCRGMDRLASREELAMVWFVDGVVKKSV
ncbi:MAG: class I SAM-dependent methyltransferase [Polyangiaceae bacterium]|nr:class I SAM-dependent methyltransferase [Polyangiaceae bacterium]